MSRSTSSLPRGDRSRTNSPNSHSSDSSRSVSRAATSPDRRLRRELQRLTQEVHEDLRALRRQEAQRSRLQIEQRSLREAQSEVRQAEAQVAQVAVQMQHEFQEMQRQVQTANQAAESRAVEVARAEAHQVQVTAQLRQEHRELLLRAEAQQGQLETQLRQEQHEFRARVEAQQALAAAQMRQEYQEMCLQARLTSHTVASQSQEATRFEARQVEQAEAQNRSLSEAAQTMRSEYAQVQSQESLAELQVAQLRGELRMAEAESKQLAKQELAQFQADFQTQAAQRESQLAQLQGELRVAERSFHQAAKQKPSSSVHHLSGPAEGSFYSSPSHKATASSAQHDSQRPHGSPFEMLGSVAAMFQSDSDAFFEDPSASPKVPASGGTTTFSFSTPHFPHTDSFNPGPSAPCSSGASADQLLSNLVHAVTLLSEQKTGLKSDKPKLSCKDAAGLKHELDRFKRYMHEMHAVCGSRWIRAARIVAEDRAQEVLKDVLIQTFGSESVFNTCIEQDPGNAAWERVWQLYERRLRVAAGLEPQDEMKDVLSEYTALKVEGNAPTALSTFLDEYSRLRTLMIEKQLITQDAVGILRETQDILHKLKAHEVFRYLNDLEYKCTKVDSFDEDERAWTIIGRCRQWLQSRLPNTNTADRKSVV